jgi:hypothetical protein
MRLICLSWIFLKQHGNWKWKPVLNFEELIRFTVDGYTAELTEKNIYSKRVKQISDMLN